MAFSFISLVLVVVYWIEVLLAKKAGFRACRECFAPNLFPMPYAQSWATLHARPKNIGKYSLFYFLTCRFLVGTHLLRSRGFNYFPNGSRQQDTFHKASLRGFWLEGCFLERVRVLMRGWPVEKEIC